MKFAIPFMLIFAALVAGCGRPVVRETVVERPVYVNQPAPATVITQPAAGATSPPACVYAGQPYSHGALSCQDRTEFKCNNGSWTRTFTAC